MLPLDQQQDNAESTWMDPYANSDDDFDNDDDSTNNNNHDKESVAIIKELRQKAPHFINSLDDCPLILGFHAIMTHANADECCFCPCSKKLQPWREHYRIQLPICGDGKKAQRYTPNGLVAHLRPPNQQMNLDATSMYHIIALKYLEALYQNYWGQGIHHKGLYILATSDYKKAQAKEKSHEIACVWICFGWIFSFFCNDSQIHHLTGRMMNRLRDDLAKAQQQKIEAEERADRWEKIKSVRCKSAVLCVFWLSIADITTEAKVFCYL